MHGGDGLGVEANSQRKVALHGGHPATHVQGCGAPPGFVEAIIERQGLVQRGHGTRDISRCVSPVAKGREYDGQPFGTIDFPEECDGPSIGFSRAPQLGLPIPGESKTQVGAANEERIIRFCDERQASSAAAIEASLSPRWPARETSE